MIVNCIPRSVSNNIHLCVPLPLHSPKRVVVSELNFLLS